MFCFVDMCRSNGGLIFWPCRGLRCIQTAGGGGGTKKNPKLKRPGLGKKTHRKKAGEKKKGMVSGPLAMEKLGQKGGLAWGPAISL